MEQQRAALRYRTAWVALVLVFCVGIAVWSARIGTSFGPDRVAAPSPTVTAAPDIVTLYTDIGPPNPSTLCAELAPQAKVVTVETFTGVVLARLNCPNG